MAKKTALLILDGWGIGSRPAADAILQAHTPFFDMLWSRYPPRYTHVRGIGRIPAGAQYVGGRKQMRDQVGARHLGCRNERAIGQWHAREWRLGSGHEFALHARRLEAVLAVRASVVGQAKRADDKLAGSHGLHVPAHLDDHAAVLVAHVGRSAIGLKPAVRPQIGTANAGGRQLYDGVRRFQDLGIFDLLEADIAWPVHHCSKHSFVPVLTVQTAASLLKVRAQSPVIFSRCSG